MTKKRVAILISGRGSNMTALIEACAHPDFPAEVGFVLANDPDAPGLARAAGAGIATTVIDHRQFADRASFDAAVHAALVDAETEIVCLAGFMRIMTAEFVRKWEGRMINIHPSLLPLFRGLDTHRRALEAGVRIAGCTVHFVSAELDAGPIIAQAAVPVLPGDTADTLAARILRAEHRLYPAALEQIAFGNFKITNQSVELEPSSAADESRILSSLQ